MQFYNIVTKKTYTDKSGQEKGSWKTVGRVKVAPDNNMFIDLFMFPDTKFYLFLDDKDRDREAQHQTPQDDIDISSLGM